MSEEPLEYCAERAAEQREKILSLEAAMRSEQQVEIETNHYFSKGIYAREIRIPAGVLLTGKIHRFEHLNIISAGKLRIITEDFDEVVSAPATFTAFPGVKKVLLAIENTVFTTVHATDLTDIDEIERVFVTEDYDDITIEGIKPCHLLQ
jgi:hypothetical protein